MPPRSVVVGVLVGTLAGIVFFRRRAASRERVEIYFDDGSLVTLNAGSPEGERMLAPARAILAAARPS